MNQVIFNRQSHVAANRAWFGFHRIGCAHHHTDGFGGVGAADRDSDNRAAAQVVDNIVEKRSIFVFGVVGFHRFARSVEQLETGDFKPAKFDAADDFSVEAAGYSARLDQNQSRFHKLSEVTDSGSEHFGTRGIWYES